MTTLNRADMSNWAGCSPADLGADPTGGDDATDELNKAIAKFGSLVSARPAIYRVDGTLEFEANQSSVISPNITFRRKGTGSGGVSNTDPVAHIKGGSGDDFEGARVFGGIWESENISPGGVVVIGHADTTSSNYNARRSHFSGFKVRGASTASDCVGIRLPSSQPVVGDTASSYFHSVANGEVITCGRGIELTNISNAHHLSDITFRNIGQYAYRLEGAYGNFISGGFVDSGVNGVIGVGLLNSSLGSPPHHSDYNFISGFRVEPGGILSEGVYIGTNCVGNQIAMLANTGGGSTLLNLNNNINTVFQQAYTGGTYAAMDVSGSLIVQRSAVLKLQSQWMKRYTGTVAENATVTGATVTLASTRYGATVYAYLQARSPAGLRGGGASAIYRINRDDDGGADTTKIDTLEVLPSVNTSNKGVTFAAPTSATNGMNIRLFGWDNGGVSSYTWELQIVVVIDNFAAATLS